MSAVAAGVAAIDLQSYQQAVRTLLVSPLVTENRPHKGALGHVRRWEDQLRADFDALVRYRLDVTPTCARLVKRPLDLDPRHPFCSRTARPFDRRRYAYVSLSLSLLLRAGVQVLVTELARQLEGLATGIDELGYDADVFHQRQAFVDSVRWLEDVDALRACEGSTDAYLRDGEALYDVNHDVVHELFQPPVILQRVASVDGLFVEHHAENREGIRRHHRQRIVRSLLERPVVYSADQLVDEREPARRDASAIAADVERFCGGVVERRSEGIALIDPGLGMTDRKFPSPSGASHVALLLAERLIAARSAAGTSAVPAPRPHETIRERLDAALPFRSDDDADEASDVEPAPTAGWFVDRAEIDRAAQEIITTYGAVLRRDLAADVGQLADAALGELFDFDMLRTVPGGYVALAPLARYRAEVNALDEHGAQLSFGTGL